MQEKPTSKFFTDLNSASALLNEIPLSLLNIDAGKASAFSLVMWFKDGNPRTMHQWKQEIPNQGNSIDELRLAPVDQEYAFDRAEKVYRDGFDKIGRRFFYHARTA